MNLGEVCHILQADVMCSESILKLVRERQLVVMATGHPMYSACGLLYSHGLTG